MERAGRILVGAMQADIWRAAMAPFLASRLLLLLVGLLADYYLLPLTDPLLVSPSVASNQEFPANLARMWQRFDSGFYLSFAMQGYQLSHTVHHASSWAFYPLYPLLIAPGGRLLGGGILGYRIAALAISNGAALLAVAYLYLLVRDEFGGPAAARTVTYLAFFPTSFYLSAIYPESLFLVCAVACLYYARANRWWLAGVCGGLASLARAQGVLLILPVAWEYWRALDAAYVSWPARAAPGWHEDVREWLRRQGRGLAVAAREERTWQEVSAILLIPFGLFLFLLYAKWGTGDWLANFDTLQRVWGRSFAPPWSLLASSLAHPEGANPQSWNFWTLNVALMLAGLGAVVWAFRRLPVSFALYTLVMVLAPLSSSRLNSIGRYYLAVFPALLLLALWSGRRRGSHQLIVGSFAALQAVFMIFFVLGLPAIA